jgi:hypothetical protein
MMVLPPMAADVMLHAQRLGATPQDASEEACINRAVFIGVHRRPPPATI